MPHASKKRAAPWAQPAQASQAREESAAIERFRQLLAQVRYKPGSGFRLTQNGECVFLQHHQALPDCTVDPAESPTLQVRGRKFYLSPHMTDAEVIQTALMAVIAFEEHEAREAFLFRGDRIFGPHKSLASLRVVDEEHRPIPEPRSA
jgi:hypothetical protein